MAVGSEFGRHDYFPDGDELDSARGLTVRRTIRMYGIFGILSTGSGIS